MVKRKHYDPPAGYGGIWNPRKHIRQHRRQAHFEFGHVPTTMEIDAGGHHADKKAKHNHEAQLIPGLGPLEYGFPNSIITKLRYNDYFSFTSTTGGVGLNIWRANGIFDPDYTNIGHQPLYRDTYAGIYDFYTVLGSKITVHYQSESATVGALIGIVGSDTPTLSTTINTLCEMNNTVSELIGSVNAGGKNLFMTYSPMEQLGSNVKDDNSTMTSVGADPTSGEGTFYYGVWVASADGSSTVKVTVKIQIEYTVKFTYLSKPVQN